MKSWLRVSCSDDFKIILEVFPYEPGGATLYLTPEEALWLARLLEEAAAPLDKEEADA